MALEGLERGNLSTLIKQRKGGGGLKVHSKGRYGQIRYVEIDELTHSSNFRAVVKGLAEELAQKRDLRRHERARERRRVRFRERLPVHRRSTGSSQ